jgi:hypothetical protein
MLLLQNPTLIQICTLNKTGEDVAMFLLFKKKIIIFVSALFLINITFADTTQLCPSDPLVLKKAVANNSFFDFKKKFSKECIQEIKYHYLNREANWIAIAPFISQYISVTFLTHQSLLQYPKDTLETINQSPYLSDNLGFICEFFNYEDESELSKKIKTIIIALKEIKNLSTSVDFLRQKCINYFEKQEFRNNNPKVNTCPKTPEGMASLIKEDNGASLFLDSEYCPNYLFDTLRTGDSKWLTTLAPVLMNTPRTESMLDLSHRFQDNLIFALPRNPKDTFEIIAKYFPDKVNEVCYSKVILENYEEGNIDEYKESEVMDIPGAISGLKTLKLEDKQKNDIRDRCIARLEETLKTAEPIEMNGGAD